MTLRMRECKHFHHNVRRTIHAIGNSLSEAKIHESCAFISLKMQTNQGLFFYIILQTAQAVMTPMSVQNKEIGIALFNRLTAQFDR